MIKYVGRLAANTLQSKGFPLSRADWEAQGRPNWRLFDPDGEEIEICQIAGCRYFVLQMRDLWPGLYTLRAGALEEQIYVVNCKGRRDAAIAAKEKKCL